MKFGYLLDSSSYEPHYLDADSFIDAITQLEGKLDVTRMACRKPDVPFVELWADKGIERKSMSFEDLKEVFKLYPDVSGSLKCQDLCLKIWDDLWQRPDIITPPGVLAIDFSGFKAGTNYSDISMWLDDHTAHGIESLIVGVPNSIGDDKLSLEPICLLARSVRDEMVERYGPDLQGKCIEASERLVKRLSESLNLEAITVAGWCRFDDEHYGSDRPWDPHTWVEIPTLNLYVDITADQFNWGMFTENDYSPVTICQGLPHGMQYNEPTWSDFDLEDTEKSNEPLSDIQYGINDNWLHAGQKVKILNPYFEGQVGTIQSFMWTTGNYIVTMSNGNNLPFRPSELEEAADNKIPLADQIVSASLRAAEPLNSSRNQVKEQTPER